MIRRLVWPLACAAAVFVLSGGPARGGDDPLAVGAGHAFDHLGAIGEQAPAAAASGATIIYPGGVGTLGYQGLPAAEQFKQAVAGAGEYVKQAKAHGIRLAIGYVCATSIVKLDNFDQHWPAELRAQFSSAPSSWLQQDRDGKALASWYGGDYRPACMNHPDWRAYEKFIVRAQLEAGHDGIFFDNPTVHPQGCYCEHCMKKFAAFLGGEFGAKSIDDLRRAAIDRPRDFLLFRGTIAADFLAEMRTFARTINPAALITCNNSLNSPEAFFSQCRTYGYNIFELSKVEDLVVVEDMATQPRTNADGTTIEYGPVYEMLRAIAHGKPIVAVTLADGDYHTPANLMRLAMAEAAAHEASYLSWPTWPEAQRERMIAAVRPQALFLREHADVLNGTQVVADAVIALPFEKWLETDQCAALATARELAAKNVQFTVTCEGKSESAAKIPAIVIENAPRVRAIVRRKGEKTIVHLLNLDIRKISSFEDQVNAAADVRIRVRTDRAIKGARALTADVDATQGSIPFAVEREGDTAILQITVPRLVISTILVIE